MPLCLERSGRRHQGFSCKSRLCDFLLSVSKIRRALTYRRRVRLCMRGDTVFLIPHFKPYRYRSMFKRRIIFVGPTICIIRFYYRQ